MEYAIKSLSSVLLGWKNRHVSALEAFGLIAGVASFVGLALAFYYGRRDGQKRKLFVYRAGVGPIPFASTRSLAEYNLLLLHEPKKGTIKRIDSAYVHYVQFANFGREPIRRDDLAPANPLRIAVEGAPVLDAAIQAVRREVSQTEIGAPHADGAQTTIPITFDFLDYLDGALVRVMTDTRPSSVNVVGDIVGMPSGLHRPADLEGRRAVWLSRIGGALIVLFVLSAVALTPFVYRWVTGTWHDVWLMALPVVALVLPLVICAAVGATIWPSGRLAFPKELEPHGLPYIGHWAPIMVPDAVVDVRFRATAADDETRETT